MEISGWKASAIEFIKGATVGLVDHFCLGFLGRVSDLQIDYLELEWEFAT